MFCAVAPQGIAKIAAINTPATIRTPPPFISSLSQDSIDPFAKRKSNLVLFSS
jgi:hypothetical protein